MQVLKPVISGFTPDDAEDSDTLQLLRALGRPATPEAIDAMSPWRFSDPLSPDMAAARESRAIEFDDLVSFCKSSIDAHDGMTLIEGVGGIMVPLTQTHTVLDWVSALEIPTVLVVGSYLGTLSHTLTAVETMRARGVRVAGVVISESDEQPVPLSETAETIIRFLPGVRVYTVPRSSTAPPDVSDLVELCRSA